MTAESHIPDDDLERLLLHTISDESALERLEQHLLVCAACIDRAEETRQYVGIMRAALAQRKVA